MVMITEQAVPGEAVGTEQQRGKRTLLLRHVRRSIAVGLSSLALLSAGLAHAQQTICARVKIEIKQELTLERQAFDAQMKISNTTAAGIIENVSVVVKVTEEDGTPVIITDDPNNLSAKFFVRLSSKENISDVNGTGTVSPNTTSTINWLLIPAPGSAGSNPLGKKYLVGATLKYRFAGEDQVLDIFPDVVTVKPLPLLTLDYFLPRDVFADDPLTLPIEPAEPFTLGVRVKNNGFATAKGLKIDSAQPKIVENNQGLLINFLLTGSHVNDAPVQNTLLLNFGDIDASKSKTGRWVMETTLAGTFVDFTARFTHSDELGGALTSIMQATNAHFLIRDVRVDLPGRDLVRDFLAQDGDFIRVYESDGPDTLVTDRSSVAQLTTNGSNYQLSFPATAGFAYAKLPDPFNGQKVLGRILRADAKLMLPENVWLSKTRNPETKQWEYWVNVFDVNTPGTYNTEFKTPDGQAAAPVIQFIPDRIVEEGKQVSFLVEASSPNGKAVTLSAAPLPAAAVFTAQAPRGGLSTSVFDWTPAVGQAGIYLLVYTATDGTLSSTRSASIKVETVAPPSGPATPLLVAPLADAHVASTRPSLVVQTGTNANDPTMQVQFEVYGDSAMTQLIDSGIVTKGVTTGPAGTTSFRLTKDLNDNTRYWWHARASDGQQTYSNWINSKFFVNLFNNAPENFNLTSPAPNVEVSILQPTLVWTNSTDKDEDPITYRVTVYKDAGLTDLFTSVTGIAPDASGSTSWAVDKPLTNHVKYYWRVVAADSHNASTASPARPFTVNTGNAAPTRPVIQSPLAGSTVTTPTVTLTIANSTDADNDLITYVFELDTINTFDSGNKQASGQVIQGAGSSTGWTVHNLVENQRYHWRAKAQDGRAESDWVIGRFLMSAVNDAPPAPTIKNPSNGAWVATQQPTLEANAVVDPEGEAVQYQFEIYRDAALADKATDGISNSTGWIVPSPLTDKTTYYWRVRAADSQGTASAWSAPAVMYVSAGAYIDPTILVTAPATIQAPVMVGEKKTVTINWEGTNQNIDPTIALYYSTSNSGYAGTLIIDGIKQAVGTHLGSHVWDVTSLASGTYYVYAVIYDARGVGRSYASGAVVIAPSSPAGSIVITPPTALTVSEDGGQTTFTVNLGSVPTADVEVPVSSSDAGFGFVSPATLTFTPANWQTPQTVTITGAGNCVSVGDVSYEVQVGMTSSLDPNYFNLQASPIVVTTIDNDGRKATSNNANIHLCNYTVIKETQVNAKTWDYVLTPELTNTGVDVGGIRAVLSRSPSGTKIIEGELIYGAVSAGNTAKTSDSFTIRSGKQLVPTDLRLGKGFYWNVTTR